MSDRRSPRPVPDGPEQATMQFGSGRGVPLAGHGLTLDGLRRELGGRWEIVAIAQGFRAIPRETAGHAPVALYGRTPADLAESIRMAQVSP